MNNARLAARLARAGRCRGILLDTEQYRESSSTTTSSATRAAVPGPNTQPRRDAAGGR